MGVLTVYPFLHVAVFCMRRCHARVICVSLEIFVEYADFLANFTRVK